MQSHAQEHRGGTGSTSFPGRVGEDGHKTSAGFFKAHLVHSPSLTWRETFQSSDKLHPVSADITPNHPHPGGGLDREWYRKREGTSSSHMALALCMKVLSFNISNRPSSESSGTGLDCATSVLVPLPAKVSI